MVVQAHEACGLGQEGSTCAGDDSPVIFSTCYDSIHSVPPVMPSQGPSSPYTSPTSTATSPANLRCIP